MSGFKIGSRQVGDGAPALIVAEVGLAHDGSLVAAHSYIDAVAEAGADAVKFQCHTGDPVSEWRIPPPLVTRSQGFFTISTTCGHCRGEGNITPHPCKECHGHGKVKKTKKIQMKIPPGV